MPVPLLVVPRGFPDVPVPIFVVLGASRFLEPLVLVAGMVDDQVHDQFHAPLVAALYEAFDVLDGAVLIRDTVVV